MLSEYVIYVLVLCLCVCDAVHVFTQQEIGLFWGGFRTGELKILLYYPAS